MFTEKSVEKSQQALLEQYRIYIDTMVTEAGRGENTCRIYLVIIFALQIVLSVKDYSTTLLFPVAPVILSIFGMALTILWWFKIDYTRTHTRIRTDAVLTKMEEQLPFKCFTLEKEEYERRLKESDFFGKLVVMPNLEKYFALMTFLALEFLFLYKFSSWLFKWPS